MFSLDLGLVSGRQFLLLACLISSPLFVQEGPSCFCLSQPICSQPRNPSGKRTVFTGTVLDISPASMNAYGSPESDFNGGMIANPLRHTKRQSSVSGGPFYRPARREALSMRILKSRCGVPPTSACMPVAYDS